MAPRDARDMLLYSIGIQVIGRLVVDRKSDFELSSLQVSYRYRHSKVHNSSQMMIPARTIAVEVNEITVHQHHSPNKRTFTKQPPFPPFSP
jgi:hypothetical protein